MGSGSCITVMVCGEIVTEHPDARSAFNHVTNQLDGLLGDDTELTQAKGLGGDTAVKGLNKMV